MGVLERPMRFCYRGEAVVLLMGIFYGHFLLQSWIGSCAGVGDEIGFFSILKQPAPVEVCQQTLHAD